MTNRLFYYTIKKNGRTTCGRKEALMKYSEEENRQEREKLYKQISRSYTLLRKLSNVEDAKKIVDEIYQMKRKALELELEALKNETS